jgi:LmbE family N-acetylglucosaminyl deacetylase
LATAVFFHAHPDDEAIATAGTMAKMSSEGHRVVLVAATRGELGEVPEGILEQGETLGDRRTAELEQACSVLGVARLEFLGYRDSGMAGAASNDDPGCFWRADLEEASERLAALLTEEQADVLCTYDEHGVYGHPDHVKVHTVGMRASEIARTPAVYMATQNRDRVVELTKRAEELGVGPLVDGDDQFDADAFGEPEARITTAVDVTDQLSAKRRAMQAHASQIAETSFFLAMPESTFELVWGTEWYIRVGAPRARPMTTSLLA